MIKEIQPKSKLAINLNQGGQLNSRFVTTPDSNMQQSSGIRTGFTANQDQQMPWKANGLNRDAVKKILKFEKVIKKFCDQIGVDKQALIGVLFPEKVQVPQDSINTSGIESVAISYGNREASAKSQIMNQIDTRKAAMLAYTNLDNSVDTAVPQTDWRRNLNTRNQSAKNLSADKTSNSEIAQPSPAKLLDTNAKRTEFKDQIKSVKQQNRQKGLSGGNIMNTTAQGSNNNQNSVESAKRARSINKSKFVDPDSSLFLDGKRTVSHDKSFTENIDEKNRMHYQQQDAHHISQTDIMKKRHNSTERSSKVQRPKSSKGYRGSQANQSSNVQIPRIQQNKSEDRILKSQGNQRAIMQAQAMAKFAKGANIIDPPPAQKSFHLQQLQEGNSLSSSNFANHSKSQKPIEFKKIQNLSVKSGGQAQVTNMPNSMQSQKNLIKINYDDLKKALTRDG